MRAFRSEKFDANTILEGKLTEATFSRPSFFSYARYIFLRRQGLTCTRSAHTLISRCSRTSSDRNRCRTFTCPRVQFKKKVTRHARFNRYNRFRRMFYPFNGINRDKERCYVERKTLFSRWMNFVKNSYSNWKIETSKCDSFLLIFVVSTIDEREENGGFVWNNKSVQFFDTSFCLSRKVGSISIKYT